MMRTSEPTHYANSLQRHVHLIRDGRQGPLTRRYDNRVTGAQFPTFVRRIDSTKVAFKNQLQTQCGRIGFTQLPYVINISPRLNRGSMNDESDFDLRSDQWEALKALRAPFARASASTRLVLDDLVALGLVTMSDHVPVITAKGRKALVRGSFSLMDAAA
jgi:hypothetical protein